MNPDMVSSRVDFPAELAPIKATISLDRTTKDTSQSAWKDPWKTASFYSFSNSSDIIVFLF